MIRPIVDSIYLAPGSGLPMKPVDRVVDFQIDAQSAGLVAREAS